MTDTIEWGELLTGPEVKALGLPGETWVSADDMPLRLRDWALLSDTPFYQLPADHPAYIVHRYNKKHGTNFVYWAGGVEAPEDWDGGDVLFRDGILESGRDWDWHHSQSSGDIIGYTKKPQLVTEEASEPLQRAVNWYAPANHGPAADDKGEAGDFIPCERTVRMCIEALPYPGSNTSYKRALEAILPKPDRAGELVKQYIREAYPKWEHVWENAGEDELNFAKWLIERGDIKG